MFGEHNADDEVTNQCDNDQRDELHTHIHARFTLKQQRKQNSLSRVFSPVPFHPPFSLPSFLSPLFLCLEVATQTQHLGESCYLPQRGWGGSGRTTSADTRHVPWAINTPKIRLRRSPAANVFWFISYTRAVYHPFWKVKSWGAVCFCVSSPQSLWDTVPHLAYFLVNHCVAINVNNSFSLHSAMVIIIVAL